MTKQYKVNSQITIKEVRLIAEDGKQIGVLSRDEALDYALGQGADLVLIGERANPPVAKIIDYKKFLYQEQKKEKEAKKGQKGSGVKEVRIGSPFAGQADINTRIVRVKDFLEDGFSVKIVIKFVGRQITHPEFGHKIMNHFREQLAKEGKVDREAHFEGKQLIMIMSPAKQ